MVETQTRSAAYTPAGKEHPQGTPAEISRAEAQARDVGAVVVDIYDQIYQLRGVNPEYIERLAGVVDSKMRAVSAYGATVDTLRVAVLAALNLADELVSLRGRYESLNASVEASRQAAAQSMVRTRAGSLMGMLDAVLEERKVG
ncbi:MAG: cell division protein ZapA [Acidobacteriaceae bacterium]